MDTASASDPLYPRAASQDETFYDTSELNNPEHDNAVNQKSKPELTPEELAEQERQQEEWRKELAKLEEEIMTLQSVLHAKVRQQSELKRKLGITTVTELKQDMQQGIQNIKESNAYVKTSAAFKNFGAYTSRKMGDLRNSNTFKSIEDKMSGAYTNVKGKVSGSKSENDFENALNNAANAEGDSSPTEGATGSTEKLPEEKVPL